MKIKDGFTLHQIGDEYIIMYNGTQNVDFNNIISLWKEWISMPTPLPTSLWKIMK